MTAGLPHLGQRFPLTRPQPLLGKSRCQPRSRTSNPSREVKLSSTSCQPRGSCRSADSAAAGGESRKRSPRVPEIRRWGEPAAGRISVFEQGKAAGALVKLTVFHKERKKRPRRSTPAAVPMRRQGLNPREAHARQATDHPPALPSSSATPPKPFPAAASRCTPCAAAPPHGACRTCAAFELRLSAGALKALARLITSSWPCRKLPRTPYKAALPVCSAPSKGETA